VDLRHGLDLLLGCKSPRRLRINNSFGTISKKGHDILRYFRLESFKCSKGTDLDPKTTSAADFFIARGVQGKWVD